MLNPAAFNDLRNYIKRRIKKAQYRVGQSYYPAEINDIKILSNGVVRAILSIIPNDKVTINRVELYNSDNERWVHQDVNIKVDEGQTGILYWFDFAIIEGGQ